MYVAPSEPVAVHNGFIAVNDDSGLPAAGSMKSLIEPVTPISGVRSPFAVRNSSAPGTPGVAVRPPALPPLMKSR